MACFSAAPAAPDSWVTRVLDAEPRWLDISPALWQRALDLDARDFCLYLRLLGNERATLDLVRGHGADFLRVKILILNVLREAAAPGRRPAPPPPHAPQTPQAPQAPRRREPLSRVSAAQPSRPPPPPLKRPTPHTHAKEPTCTKASNAKATWANKRRSPTKPPRWH
ncbi:hypothetical protein M885DRAFT_526084 [Pelagophyceae sp. CCMP2097]|nr:hypothetical protein M885DRAFT_526084 [Pelagophyceae sp. CCMP2097]